MEVLPSDIVTRMVFIVSEELIVVNCNSPNPDFTIGIPSSILFGNVSYISPALSKSTLTNCLDSIATTPQRCRPGTLHTRCRLHYPILHLPSTQQLPCIYFSGTLFKSLRYHNSPINYILCSLI